MAYVWKPSIYKNSSLEEFPHPVTSLRSPVVWDMKKHKVPLNDGTTTEGHSKNGREIEISGAMGTVTGTTKTTQQEMFEALTNLESKLDVSSDSDKFEFFIYHDDDSTTYQKLKDVVCQKFDWEIGEEQNKLFKWSATLFAEDPVFYQTAPGA